MTLTHRDLAGLVAALYGEAGAPAVTWAHLEPDDAPVMFAVARIEPFLIVVCRGSFTFMDWVHDAVILSQKPMDHPDFGPVHAGFYDGVVAAWSAIAPMIAPGDAVVFAGHSLGAAHAEFLAAHMLLEMKRAPYVRTWGAPRPGFQAFADIAAAIPGASDSNFGALGYDPVPDLPWTTKLLPYVPARPAAQVTQPPSANVVLDLGPSFGWHHFGNYLLATPPGAVPVLPIPSALLRCGDT
jgi:Lipase (class 3)